MVWIEAGLLIALILAASGPHGGYMYRVFEGERTWLTRVFAPVERAVYVVCRIEPASEMSWMRG